MVFGRAQCRLGDFSETEESGCREKQQSMEVRRVLNPCLGRAVNQVGAPASDTARITEQKTDDMNVTNVESIGVDADGLCV